jgi:type VI secretion system secreted protein Hcp
MAFDAFLVFTTESGQPTLQGETQDAQFKSKHAVEIKSFSLGISNTINIGSQSSGAGAGKAQLHEFTISKAIDKLSPTLLQLAGSGGHISQMDLYLRKAGGGGPKGGLVFLQYTFKLVFVATIDWSGSAGDEAPKEDVTFKYGALEIQFTGQKANGQKGTTTTGAWNQVKNNSSINVPGVGS